MSLPQKRVPRMLSCTDSSFKPNSTLGVLDSHYGNLGSHQTSQGVEDNLGLRLLDLDHAFLYQHSANRNRPMPTTHRIVAPELVNTTPMSASSTVGPN
jgi:hypothetical protein